VKYFNASKYLVQSTVLIIRKSFVDLRLNPSEPNIDVSAFLSLGKLFDDILTKIGGDLFDFM